jgi:hypothetical protein
MTDNSKIRKRLILIFLILLQFGIFFAYKLLDDEPQAILYQDY